MNGERPGGFAALWHRPMASFRISSLVLLSALAIDCSPSTSATPDAGPAIGSADAGSDTGPPPVPDAGPPPAPDAGPPPAPDAGPPPAPDAGPTTPRTGFAEVAATAGLVFDHGDLDSFCQETFEDCRAISSTGAVAVGDYDGDGWPDLFVGGYEDGALFRNLGDGTFADVTVAVGLTFATGIGGAAWADVDRDGDLDLYATAHDQSGTWTRHYFFIQQDDGTFVDEAVARGNALEVDEVHAGGTVAFGDYDLDGWVDLYATEWWTLHHVPLARLFHNRGAEAPGHYEDVTLASGALAAPESCWTDGCPIVGFASSFTDLDDDGWPDLLMVQDFGESRLYWNDGDGTFTEGTEAANVGTDEYGMGGTVGDIDGDGDLDWFVSAIGDTGARCGPRLCQSGYNGNRLYRNDGNRVFTDITDEADVRHGGWGWGTALIDFDNDADLDLFLVNGFTELALEYEDPWNLDHAYLWTNDGTGRFANEAFRFNFYYREHATGMSVFDYDRDGDLDLVMVEHAGPVRLWENRPAEDLPWLRVRLRGDVSNPEGLHSRIRVQAVEDGPEQLRVLESVTHFQGQSERVAHFGLGDLEGATVHRVTVSWPSGRVSELRDVAVRQLLVLDEPPG
jgi:hypothetical protein